MLAYNVKIARSNISFGVTVQYLYASYYPMHSVTTNSVLLQSISLQYSSKLVNF